jgi:hypothetical protein
MRLDSSMRVGLPVRISCIIGLGRSEFAYIGADLGDALLYRLARLSTVEPVAHPPDWNWLLKQCGIGSP